MSLRPEELVAIAEELDQFLGGGFVQKARASVGPRVELEVRQPGRSTVLIVSGEARASRLSARSKGASLGGEALPLQKWLRQELIGARVASVSVPLPRVACLELVRPAGSRKLWLEVSWGAGRITLTSEDSRVLASTDPQLRAGSELIFDVREPGLEARPTEAPNAASPARAPRLLAIDDEPLPLARAAEALFGQALKERRVDEVRRRLGASHRAKLSRLERTRDKVKADASRLPQALEHRLKGELLTQNLSRLPRGAQSVTLTHYTEEGEQKVEVKLDGKRSPREQAEWHFHQYRRLQRGVEHATRRLAELEAEAARAREALEALESEADDTLLARGSSAPSGGASRRKGPQRARPFREFRSEKGERILVGKGGQQNDELTFHLARPNDLWLHVLGAEGAHVVVPLEREQAIPPELLLDACHLALHASRAKDQGGGEVAYTQAKFVKKPKGSAPGAVSYTREKVLALKLDPSRLTRLLRSAEAVADEQQGEG